MGLLSPSVEGPSSDSVEVLAWEGCSGEKRVVSGDVELSVVLLIVTVEMGKTMVSVDARVLVLNNFMSLSEAVDDSGTLNSLVDTGEMRTLSVGEKSPVNEGNWIWPVRVWSAFEMLEDVGVMVLVSVEKVLGVGEVDEVLVDKIWVSVSVELVVTEVLISGSVVVVLGGHFGSVPSIVKV